MTTETSNARVEAEYEYEVWQGDALQAGGSTTDYASAQSEAGHYAMMYAPDGPVEVRIYEKRLLTDDPPPAAAEPKTLPVPTHVHLIGETAVVVGTPGRGWDEDAQDAHNCDAMGCATIGPHVLARVPFTDERALSQQPEARAQGGGEVVAYSEKFRASGDWSRYPIGTRAYDIQGGYWERVANGWKWCTGSTFPTPGGDAFYVAVPVRVPAPPSAPVGVEAIAAEIRASLVRGATVCTRRRWAIELEALAQQLAAVDASDARDAERYRWLRRALLGAEDEPIDHLLLEKEPETEAEFDAAVDAALATQHQEPTT